MRSFPRLAARPKGPAAAVAGLALLAVATNACAAQSPASAPSPSVTARVTPEAPAPAPSPSTVPTELAPVFGLPRWNVQLQDAKDADRSPGWSRGTVIQAGSTYLVTSGLEVRAFARDGKERWHRTFPDVEAGLGKGNGSVTVRESGGVLVATYSHPTDDHWPHPEVVEAVDPVTGHPLWKQTASPYIAVTDQTVFTPVCRGKQTGRSDDCRLSARDPRTGRARWTVDAEHVAQVVAASPRVVVLSTKPTGLRGKSWITTLDASTGRRLGVRVETAKFGGGLYPASAERIAKFNDLAGDTLVLGSTDQQGDKACMVDLEGRDPRSGSRRWKTTLRLALPVEGASCRYGLPDGSGTTLFATTSDGRPQVFDLRQGRTLWRGPEAGTIVAGDERVVMVRDDQTARLTLYDLQNGRARWSIDGPAGARNDVTVALTGERLLLWESGYDGCTSVPAGPHGCVDVFDLSDGTKTLTTDGAAAGYGAGWIAARARTDNGATFSLYDTA